MDFKQKMTTPPPQAEQPIREAMQALDQTNERLAELRQERRPRWLTLEEALKIAARPSPQDLQPASA